MKKKTVNEKKEVVKDLFLLNFRTSLSPRVTRYVTYGILMMPDRNNYARIDVGILYRLRTVMYQMCVHNYSVQSVGSSERTIVVYVQTVSLRTGFFVVIIDFC